MEKKHLNLDEIKNDHSEVKSAPAAKHAPASNLKKVSIDDIAPRKPKADEAEERKALLRKELDTGFAAAKDRYMHDIIEPQKETILKGLIDKEAGAGTVEDIVENLNKMDEEMSNNPSASSYENPEDGEPVTASDKIAIDPSMLDEDPVPVQKKIEVKEEEVKVEKKEEPFVPSPEIQAKMDALKKEQDKLMKEQEEEKRLAYEEGKKAIAARKAAAEKAKQEEEAKAAAKAEEVKVEAEPVTPAPVDEAKDKDVVVDEATPEEESKKDDETLKTVINESSAAAEDSIDQLYSELDMDSSEVDRKREEDAKAKEEQERAQKQLRELRDSYENLVIKRNMVDLSTFSIAKKPVSVSKLLATPMSESRVSAWGLYYSAKPIVMSEIGGSELEVIAQETTNNELIDQLHTYQILHKHIIDANKGTLEDFTKRITVFDIPDLFFAAYKASFKGNNYVSFSCTNEKCNHMFMKEIHFADMVKYPNDAVRARMEKIIGGDPTSSPYYTQKLIQITSDLVVGIIVPSVYSILFEQKALSEEFRDNNRSVMNLITYIDDIYKMDMKTRMLNPIDTNPDPNNHDLTVKRRVAYFGKILQRLSSDEYAYLNSRISEYTDKIQKDHIEYVYPKVECPECHVEMPESVQSPVPMLFLRHRLGRVLNISKN